MNDNVVRRVATYRVTGVNGQDHIAFMDRSKGGSVFIQYELWERVLKVLDAGENCNQCLFDESELVYQCSACAVYQEIRG